MASRLAAQSRPGIEQIASWQQYPWLRAGFSTRQGGQTTAYSADKVGEQNLGWTDSDDPAIVAENRRCFLAGVAGDADFPEFAALHQIHGEVIHTIAAGHGPLSTPEGKAVLRGDGVISRLPGLMLGVQTADCVPVLIADTRTRAVGAFHAGWRGTLAQIIEHGVGRMKLDLDSRPEDLIAAIGPAIRPCCFAVGAEVRHEFAGRFAYAPELFSNVDNPALGPQIHLDLHEANRRQLLAAGLLPAAITVIAECTACTRLGDGRRKYFSHRAEQGFTGRMLSVIGTVQSN
jgi:YfiH family protein